MNFTKPSPVPCLPPRPSGPGIPMPGLVTELFDGLASTRGLVETLEQRLSPVLVGSPLESHAQIVKADEVLAELPARVQQAGMEVRELNRRINGILNGLQI